MVKGWDSVLSKQKRWRYKSGGGILFRRTMLDLYESNCEHSFQDQHVREHLHQLPEFLKGIKKKFFDTSFTVLLLACTIKPSITYP